jgi:hypothetical protein
MNDNAVTEVPATGFPAKAKVERLLSELGKAKTDKTDYAAKAERAGVDEQTTLNDKTFSEREIADELTRLQNLKQVYATREGGKDKLVEKLDTELGAAAGVLAQEVSAKVQQEVEKVGALLSSRVREALQLPSDKPDPSELRGLIGSSPLIRAIADCEPRNYGQLEWGGGKVSSEQKAVETLERADRLETLMKE